VTTPERFRRRQQVEGVFVVLLGVFTVGLAVHTEREDTAQQTCITSNLSDFRDALDYRASLGERESEKTKTVLMVYAKAAGILREDPNAELSERQQAAIRVDLVHALLDYRAAMREIARERKATPVPPFPTGECGDG
jgi:uncharacterized membrane protein YccC